MYSLIFCGYTLISGHEVASQKFKDWGLSMRPIPVKLEGPVYKRETILLGNNIRKQVGINMDWGIDVAKSAMFVAVNILHLILTKKKILFFWRKIDNSTILIRLIFLFVYF